nr:potassium/sodium hyperpolarization-activated cyclic nucleotide-gated channel 1-like [Onthophagus taurus]
MQRAFKETNRHMCTIRKYSESCLPKLSPNASKWEKCLRRFRKTLLLYSDHPSCNHHYRSSAAIMFERKRQISTVPVYIIHPFSKFAYYREIVWCLVYLIIFSIWPIMASLIFYDNPENQRWVNECARCVNWFIVINVVFCFISGYHNPQIREAVLRPKEIAIHYLKTYFVLDFFSSLPARWIYLSDTGKMIVILQRFVLYARVPTMFQYSRHITNLLQMSDTQHEIVSLIILSLFVLHWCACLLAIVDHLYIILGDKNMSWFRYANLSNPNNHAMTRYFWSLHVSMGHIYRLGGGFSPTESKFDYVTLSIITILGSAFFGYVIVIVLQAIGTINAAESKYEELLRQLYEYLRSKRVPVNINKRLTRYCEYRFQKRYFRTEAILATLSDHLRHEITLYTSRNLIGKVEIFKGLPRGLIGSIIACLNTEIYLKNDVIISAHKPLEYWYIISHGTVAMVHTSGLEICHLEDGDVFGCGHLMDAMDYDVNIVAIEISEILRMTKRDFLRNMNNKTIYDRLMIAIDKRNDDIKKALDKRDPKLQEREEVLYKIRKGTILESGFPRKKLSQSDDTI